MQVKKYTHSVTILTYILECHLSLFPKIKIVTMVTKVAWGFLTQ